MVLASAAKGTRKARPASLVEAEKLVKTPGRQYLWVLEYRNCHEIVIKIDFPERTVSYGMPFVFLDLIKTQTCIYVGLSVILVGQGRHVSFSKV